MKGIATGFVSFPLQYFQDHSKMDKKTAYDMDIKKETENSDRTPITLSYHRIQTHRVIYDAGIKNNCRQHNDTSSG